MVLSRQKNCRLPAALPMIIIIISLRYFIGDGFDGTFLPTFCCLDL
jgi:hypothetical protein